MTETPDAAACASDATPPDPVSTTRVWLRREFIADGLTDNQLKRLVRSGTYTKIRQGAYVLTSEWDKLKAEQQHRLRLRAILRTAHPSTVGTHRSAVIELGGPLWGIGLGIVDTTRTDKPRAGRKAPDWVQHRNRLAPDDVTERDGVRFSKAPRAALEVCTIANAEAGLIATNGLLRIKAMTVTEFHDTVDAHQDWPNSLSVNVVRQLTTDKTGSVAEDRFLYLAFRQGLPRPELQYEVFDESGALVGLTDFAWPEKRVFLEFDGRIKYAIHRREGESLEDYVLREKKREETISLITGWTCIRVTWEDLRQPALLANRIRNVFDSRASKTS